MILKNIHIQDSLFKITPKKSGETGINLSNELREMIAPDVAKGENKSVTFKIYREDYIKAACNIIGLLPLYTTSSKDAKRVDYNEKLLTDRLNSINSLFKGNETADYTVNFYYRGDGRIYLNSLSYEGFNLREFLVEDNSVLTFEKEGDTFIIRLKSEKVLGDENRQIKVGDINTTQKSYLTAIRTKPFLLLAGISGTGKSRIVRKLAQATDDIDAFANDAERFSCHSPANFCLIQVKPNWHNSMDVVGFKSNIGKEGEHYEYTPFIEFIGKAWQNLNTPFFLCLDEMNLAPVEEYFAEFLSAIESRSIDGNGSYETDPIIKPFKDFGKKVAYEMIEHLIGEKGEDVDQMSDLAKRLYYRGLTLPQNLIVMGTVNMDETTFSFSRKVLDRAMSIEMNEVNYDAFLAGTTEDDIPVLTDINNLLVDRPIKALEVKNDIDGDRIKEYLKSINAILEGTPFKLGYRAANEAILYVAASKAFGKDNVAEALDDFTLMKILSRIEGDSSKLKTANGECILESLSNFFNSEEGILSELKSSTALAKLRSMKLILERDHFVSFWN